MKVKTTKKIDLEKAKAELREAVKERDPFQKWLPTLNELTKEMEDAITANLSVTQIRKILVSSGINIPHEVLKKFLTKK